MKPSRPAARPTETVGTMTIGWMEGLIILMVLAFLIGLAFRGGYVRGRRRGRK
jgi:hypothetical protein